MWPLTRYSFSEPLRNPWMLVGLLAVCGLFVTVLVFAVLEGGAFSSESRNNGESFLQFADGFLMPVGLLLGFGLISQEVASGSIQIGMLRPIVRWRYLLARVLGRTALLGAVFVVMIGSIEVVALLKGVGMSPDRWFQWLGLLLASESVVLVLGVLGTVCTRLGSFALYWLLAFMFKLVDYFSSIAPGHVFWHRVNVAFKVLDAVVMGIPRGWVLDAALSGWHVTRLLGGWLAHATFMLALGVWAFQYRELGLRE